MLKSGFQQDDLDTRWAKPGAYLLPVLAWIAAASPLLLHGFAEGHDWLFELVRIAQYRDALTEGPFPPTWAGDLYGGYGSPIFLFYAPLFLFCTGILSLFTGSVLTGATLMLLLVFALGGWSMFHSTHALLYNQNPAVRAAAARCASCIFLLSPYLLGNAYLRNANAELTALALAPLVVSGLVACQQSPRRGALWLGPAIALVILAHNLTALWVFALALLWIGLVPSGRHSSRFQNITRHLLGLSLGLGLSAFFWVPALALKPWMRTGDLLAGKLDFHQQFPSLLEIFSTSSFFAIGPVFLVLWIAALFALWRSHRNPLAWALLFAICGCLFLAQPISAPIWDHVPFLPLYQFPWRWLGPLSLFTAWLTATTLPRWLGNQPSRLRILEGLLFVLCVANATPTLLAVSPLSAETRTSLEETLFPAGIQKLGARATVLDEYLPPEAEPDLWRRHPAWQGVVLPSPGDAQVSVELDTGHRIVLEVDAKEPTPIPLRRWFFPGWSATAGKSSTPVGQGPGGSLVVLAPAGNHRLEARIEPPPIRRAAGIISLMTVLIWLGCAAFPRLLKLLPSPVLGTRPESTNHGGPESGQTPDRKMPPANDE